MVEIPKENPNKERKIKREEQDNKVMVERPKGQSLANKIKVDNG
jgi:hypothetical protein